MTDFTPYQKCSQLPKQKDKKSKFGTQPSKGNFGKTKHKPMKRSMIKKKPTKQKRTDIIDIEFMNWKRSLYGDSYHIHHIFGRVGKELGETRNDYKTVALTPLMHSIGEKSYHSIGEKDFIEYWGIELGQHDSIKDLWLSVAIKEQEQYILQGGIIGEEHILKGMNL